MKDILFSCPETMAYILGYLLFLGALLYGALRNQEGSPHNANGLQASTDGGLDQEPKSLGKFLPVCPVGDTRRFQKGIKRIQL